MGVRVRPKLRVLPNGVRDELISNNGVFQRSEVININGVENWGRNTGYPNQANTLVFTFALPPALPNWTTQRSFTDKFSWVNNTIIYNNDSEGFNIDNTPNIVIRILKTKLQTLDINGFKLWLNNNNVKLTYQLVQPKTYLSDRLY